MTIVNTNLSITELGPNAGASNSPIKFGYVSAGSKAAADDTWTFPQVKEIMALYISDDTTGVWEEPTISVNVVTLTNASTGTASGIIIYR